MSLTDRELLARALRFYEGCPDGQYDELMVELIRERLAQQEPVALKWQQAPIRTAWGDGMVVASVAIDNDHTLSLYCERDQAPKVDAMFAQRTWVGLDDSDIGDEYVRFEIQGGFNRFEYAVRAIEAKLKQRNA